MGLERLFLLTAAAQEGGGELPLPVMVMIAMLCLMLPYLIRVKTGKSITEWLSFSAARDWIWSKIPFLQTDEEKAAAREKAKSKNAVSVSKQYGQKGRSQVASSSAASATQAQKVLSKKPEKAATNGMMQFVSDMLTFTRRRKLFVILPGNFMHDGKTAELTMLVITRARAVGVLCYASIGEVHCRKDGGAWTEVRDGKTTSLGPLCTKAKEQTAILRAALNAKGLEQVPYETALVFTSPSVVLSGEKPEYAFKAADFFKSLETERDLQGGPLVPKEIGGICNQLRPQKGKRK